MPDLLENSDALLAIGAGINLNALADTVLFTCPIGKTCIITKIVLLPTGALTQASISFGWNATPADDVIANAVHALTGATFYEIVPVKSDAKRGAAAGTFKVTVQTVEGGALTAAIAVFGFIY